VTRKSARLAAATIISIDAVYYKPTYQADADHTVASNSRSAQLPDPSGAAFTRSPVVAKLVATRPAPRQIGS
jgi:hypothetical protein